MYFALPYWRYGKLPESSHESFRGRLAGLPPVHDDLPPAPPVSQEAEQSKHIATEVCTHGRRVKFADDSSAQLPSPPSARPALAMEGCGDGPATMTSFELRELRRMLLALHRGCGVAPPDPDGYAGAVVYLLRLAREWRIAGYASGADKATSAIEDIIIHNLLADSDRTEFLQRLRAFQSSASLPLCPTCEAELAKGKTYQDLGRLIHRDCPCRPSPVSPASEAATAACAPADRDACCPGITSGVLPRAEVASVDDQATRSDNFATDVAEHRCVALPDGPDELSAAESACPPAAATAVSTSHWSRKSVIRLFQLGCLLRLVPRGNKDSCLPDTTIEQIDLDAPIASRQEAALKPSAALTLLGNTDGDARANSICDPLQDLLTIGDVKPFEDIPAFTPKEALPAFDTPAEQLALLAAPDAQPISAQDSLAVDPSCSAEIDQMLVFFIILAAHCVAFPVQDGAAVAIYHSGCDPPSLNCF